MYDFLDGRRDCTVHKTVMRLDEDTERKATFIIGHLINGTLHKPFRIRLKLQAIAKWLIHSRYLPKLRRLMSLKNGPVILLRCDIHITALLSRENLARKFHLLKF